MKNIEFDKEGILCPNCERGVIHSWRPHVMLFDYADGRTRCGMTMFMKCPYCGDDILCSDAGYKLTYNYVHEHWEVLDNIRFTSTWTIVDL